MPVKSRPLRSRRRISSPPVVESTYPTHLPTLHVKHAETQLHCVPLSKPSIRRNINGVITSCDTHRDSECGEHDFITYLLCISSLDDRGYSTKQGNVVQVNEFSIIRDAVSPIPASIFSSAAQQHILYHCHGTLMKQGDPAVSAAATWSALLYFVSPSNFTDCDQLARKVILEALCLALSSEILTNLS